MQKLKKVLAILLLLVMSTALLVGCKSEEEKKREAAQELEKQIWGDSDKTKARAEEEIKKWKEQGPKKTEATNKQ